MRIYRLELNGFKSFPDRTVVEFGPGVSCVVGPNGSGKSNILDAIKWVIGEQSAKALRGGEMMDVIFAGSQDRSPVGFAEVAMTLTAEHGEPFPGEYARLTELQVGRRLHRTGASEYFINQARCRRKDITELFLDTGVGSDLYSFIEQGSVGKIVHASPGERRTLIEEAAGISRYKARREEAQARLEATGQQLDRAADVTEEMGRRLRSLEGQVLQVARYRRLRARLRQQEVLLALARYADLAAERRRVRQALREARRAAEEAEHAVARRQAEVDARREEVAVVDAAAQSWRDEVAEQDARIRELEGALGFAARRREELREAAERAEAEATELAERREAAAADEARAVEGLGDLDGAVARATAEVAVRAEALESGRARAGEARARLEAAEREVAAEVAQVEAARGRVADLAGRLAGWPAEQARIEEALAAARGEVEAAEGRAEEVRARLAGLETERSERLRGVETASAAVRRATLDLAEAEARVAVARRALDACRRDQAVALEVLERRVAAAEAALDATSGEVEVPEVAVEGEVRAVREAVQASVRAARARAEGWLSALDEQGARDLARAERIAAAEASAAAEGRIAGAEHVREQAWAEVSAARAGQEALAERLVYLLRRRAQVDGALAAREGDAAVHLADRPTLQEHLRMGGTPEEALAALGDRAVLPVVEDPTELVALAAGLSEGAVRVAWPVRATGEGEVLPGTVLVDDLRAALRHHREHGGAAVVRGTGERVDADGTVTLGRPAASARTLVARREERRRLEGERRDLLEALARAEAEEEALADAEALARRAAEEADVAAREAREVAGEVREQALAEARTRVHTALARRRSEDRGWAARGLERVEADGEAAVARARAQATARQQERVAVGQAARVAAREALAEARRALEVLRGEQGAGRRGFEEALAAAGSHRDARRAVLGEAEAARTAARERLAEVEVARARAQGDLEAFRARAEAAARALALAAAEHERVEQERVRLEADLAEARGQIEVASARVGERPDLDGLREACRAADVARDAARAAHAAAVVDEATLSERRAGRDEAIAAMRRAHAELEERQVANAARREEISGARQRNEEAAASAESDLSGVREARGSAWDRLQRERERLAALREALGAVEEGLRGHAETRDAAARRTGDLDVQARSLQVDVEALRKRIDERYLLSLPGLLDRLDARGTVTLETDAEAREDVRVGGRLAAGVPDLVVRPGMLQDFDAMAALVDEVEETRRRLLALGEVNLAAVEEYEDVGRRHADLVAQQTDLEEAIARIRAAIAKMNRTCRERFRETFDRVADNLRVIYPRLTGGGTARLALTDEEDLLDVGVEIFVQPPGKRLQNLSLLSGGEKAMTAIAMLLALFQVKPSPFCVLDEVDAPLDEANGGRFNEVLREMADLAQFILITHNRKTMEAADTLYGITMPTPGVSRLVSVRLGA